MFTLSPWKKGEKIQSIMCFPGGGGEKTTIRPQGKHNLNTQITL